MYAVTNNQQENNVDEKEEAPNKFVYANSVPIDKIDRDNMYNTIGLNALRIASGSKLDRQTDNCMTPRGTDTKHIQEEGPLQTFYNRCFTLVDQQPDRWVDNLLNEALDDPEAWHEKKS